ncbi:MAG TPA: glycosyltransferase [Solirubrobacteraceae bacterium]|nr:glycosyltransferase [Solirubrobacteraceae bacterium]
MIAFASAVTKPKVYARCARQGIERAAEPDSVVDTLSATGSIFQSYNALLDRFAAREGLEALVLVHQDAELVDDDFCEIVRRALRDPQVGLVGCVGAIGVRSIAWWEGSVSAASFVHRYEEHGGGDLPAFSWASAAAPPYSRTGEVDTLDGFLLVLSPWVVRNVRFDESLGRFHGYDLDFCLQVRAAGRKVVTSDFRAVHHHSLQPFDDPQPWIEAHIRVAEKWDGVMPGIGQAAGTWMQRALRAEAVRDAARLQDHANGLRFEARVRELEHALVETRSSVSWRLAAPFRWWHRIAPARAR